MGNKNRKVKKVGRKVAVVPKKENPKVMAKRVWVSYGVTRHMIAYLGVSDSIKLQILNRFSYNIMVNRAHISVVTPLQLPMFFTCNAAKFANTLFRLAPGAKNVYPNLECSAYSESFRNPFPNDYE